MGHVRGTGSPYRRRGTPFWWIRYYVRGERQSESSKSTKKSVAIALLKQRLEEARLLSEAPKRMKMRGVLQEYRSDVELRGLRSAPIVRRACTIIDDRIGDILAREVSTSTLRRLQKQLKDDGYAPATNNRLVTTACSALKFAAADGLVPSPSPPAPTMLRRPKPRQGFLEKSDYVAISEELPDWGKDVFEMFYRTGWRRNEVLWLTWEEVDLEGNSSGSRP